MGGVVRKHLISLFFPVEGWRNGFDYYAAFQYGKSVRTIEPFRIASPPFGIEQVFGFWLRDFKDVATNK